jgi:CTP:molybdopterin cytidylyltransferase MocA
LTHWAIVLGDQPHVGQETLQTLLQFSGAHPQHICLPLQGGHRRHPVIMPKGEFVRLAGSTETDLKQVLDARRAVVEFCKLEDPGLSQDMDWPEDYQRMSPQC